jgi:Protein of unknown function (DUF2851)
MQSDTILPHFSLYHRYCSQPSPVIHEDAEDLPAKWTELQWQALWYSGAFGTAFQATNGSTVEIVQFGFWNRESGPDFVHAVIRIDGVETQEGDIELDMHVADWERHGHSQNHSFDRVILHLFLHRAGPDHFTRTADNRNVTQIHLQKELDQLPQRFQTTIAHSGRCCAPLRTMSSEKIDSLIETAAGIRLDRKAQQFRRSALAHGIDEALFQAIAIALGYKLNKVPFLLLAQRARLRTLRRLQAAAEAILFGLAGFLENRHQDNTAADAREYWGSLWQHWWRFRSQFANLKLPTDIWRFGMTRPANHPHRRLGALARIACCWKEFRLLTPDFDRVCHWFEELSHPFWDHHYTLDSVTTTRPVRLIGEPRINEILANVIYPALLSADRSHWVAYKKLRAQLGNKRLAIVGRRLFGDPVRATDHTQFLYQQQGLLQIFEDFCLADTTDCARCRFPQMVAELGAEPTD